MNNNPQTSDVRELTFDAVISGRECTIDTLPELLRLINGGARFQSITALATSAPVNVDALRMAADKLLENFDGFMKCNDGFMGNQGDAYNRLVKAAFADWEALRAALASMK
jgi:hypothetical protein